MQSVNANNQRLTDLFARFDVNDADASPGSSPHACTIGTRNPALLALKQRRGQLNARQETTVRQLDSFYASVQFPVTNQDLGFVRDDGRPSTAPDEIATLRRRASFLLNTDAMDSLPAVVRELHSRPDLPANSAVRLEANAILNSVKKHTEHVMGAALQDARDGDRICPLVMQPMRFATFLEVSRFHLRDILDACQLPQPARNRELKPALERFAQSYFDYSCNYEGAPKKRAQNVVIDLNSTADNQILSDRQGNITAKIAIDSVDAEQVCRSLRANAAHVEDGRVLNHRHMLRGFETLPMEKKLAGFYTQSLFKELALVQEAMGMDSLHKPEHGYAAQRSAMRTVKEFTYEGSDTFGDLVRPAGTSISQRETTTRIVAMLPELDKQSVQATGAPLITTPEVRSWVHSPDLYIDLRALREPHSRLTLQAPPLTGRALLTLPEFQH